MIFGLQIIAILFSLVMIYFAYLNFKKGELTKDEITVWLLLWAIVILVTIFPNYLRALAQNLFITRLFDFFVVGGFIFLISITSIIYMRTKRLGNKLEKLVRDEALKNVNKAKN